ncbi:MAG: stage II sporulation protein R [Peptococcaceae bacterium]|jgi:stage II sporulation protein R|nr:stage II sporulation protein R [Peptococcaceae bacterium]MDH7525201.1 stage II sporulation protein R [Peptococcaceae bacterium]
MNKKYACFLFLVILFLSLLAADGAAGDTPPLIRLHILANSDSEHDQYLKYKVRDRIVLTMAEKLSQSTGLDESRNILRASLNSMEEEASSTLRELGSRDKVKAYYGCFEFPTKYYGALTLPAGRYEAVKLVIGEGKGANWWCVLFPPLCFVKVNSGEGLPVSLPGKKTVEIKPVLAVTKIWAAVIEKITKKR